MSQLNKKTNPASVAIIGLALLACTALPVGGCMYGYPQYKVYSARLDGEATQARAHGERQRLVIQAEAERDAATLRAAAIGIVGKAAKEFPEYRQQEFIGAFAHALENGKGQTIDVNALIGRCHRHVQGGFEILCIDNVPIVEFGLPTFEHVNGAINATLNFRVLV